jgi:CubicO group peptidase (beta-lactamase class C family)
VRADWRTSRARRGWAVATTAVALALAALAGLPRPSFLGSGRTGQLQGLPPVPALPGDAPPASSPRAPDAAAIATAAAALPQLRSLLVSWQGRLVVEHYAPGVRATTPANIKSASKSVLTALVGVAIARGHLPPLDTPITRWFPALRRADDPRKQTITLEHLLTMQTGLASTSGPNYGAWVRRRDWVASALARPMVSDPGTSMEYSTGTSHVLSAVLTAATGISTWQFARDALTRPLGFTLARWPRDPRGIYFGGNDMLLTPRQMAALGELYLRDGVVPPAGPVDVIPDAPAAGTRLLPEGWVEASCTPRTRSRFDPDRE